MASALWLTVSLLIAGYLAWRVDSVGFGRQELIALIIGGGLGLIQLFASTKALRKTDSGDGSALQRYVLLSFSLKFIVLIALGVFLWATRGEDGEFYARPDFAFMAYLGLVFLGFAWHGKLLEAQSEPRKTEMSRPPGASEE